MAHSTSKTRAASRAAAATDAAGLPAGRQGFRQAARMEWIKLRSVRSSWWTLAATFVLGAGLTVLLCWANADWLASDGADESAGSFITWGMMIAQITAVILGALVVTTEYGTGMIRSTFAAVPSRGRVLAAKAVLLVAVLFVVGTVTAAVTTLVALSLVTVPLAVADSVALGVGVALCGLAFGGVALVAAQLTSTTRAAYGLTGAVMAAAYADPGLVLDGVVDPEPEQHGQHRDRRHRQRRADEAHQPERDRHRGDADPER